jgi:hypothetical protein
MHDTRRLLWRATTASTFSYPAECVCFRSALERYLRADASKAKPRQRKALADVERWLQQNERLITQSLVENHWPVSTARSSSRFAGSRTASPTGASACGTSTG